MATITFNTLKFIRRLEAMAEAFQQAQTDQRPVTQEYLDYRLGDGFNRLIKIKWRACGPRCGRDARAPTHHHQPFKPASDLSKVYQEKLLELTRTVALQT